jgi:hypothetical protein
MVPGKWDFLLHKRGNLVINKQTTEKNCQLGTFKIANECYRIFCDSKFGINVGVFVSISL